ncbi:uncharacterized protein [Apostichopus japonicus]
MRVLRSLLASVDIILKPRSFVGPAVVSRRGNSSAATKDENVSRVLVTGASGYVASCIVNELLTKGYTVRGTVRSLSNPNKVDPLKSLAERTPGTLELVEADLLSPETWKSAVEGCSHVLHTASPFPFEQPKNAEEVVRPAVDGTLSVLRACKEAGTVKRVVITSSVASVGVYHTTRPLTEEDWTDPSRGGPEAEPYIISKLMAEKEAFKYIESLDDKDKFEFCTVLPGFVIGPSVANQAATSLDIVKRIMVGGDPLIPNIAFTWVDVRDVADAHIKCMTLKQAAGQRFLITDKSLTYRDVCKQLYDEFHDQGYSPSLRLAPRLVIRLMSLFDNAARSMNLVWGVVTTYDNSKMKNVLGIQPRDCRQGLIDMAYSLIENGYIEKSPKFKGRKTS